MRSLAINPYITFNGTCEAAFEFYKSVFGGDFVTITKFKDMPPMEGFPPMSEAMQNMIMHVSLPIGENCLLMGSDVGDQHASTFNAGNNIAISINGSSKEEADRIFNALSQGGTVTMPIGDTFWGAYFGMFTDKFGIHWMVNFDK